MMFVRSRTSGELVNIKNVKRIWIRDNYEFINYSVMCDDIVIANMKSLQDAKKFIQDLEVFLNIRVY